MEQDEHPFPEMKPVTTAFIMISVNPELEKEIAEKLIAKVIYADLAASHPIKAFFPAEPLKAFFPAEPQRYRWHSSDWLR